MADIMAMVHIGVGIPDGDFADIIIHGMGLMVTDMAGLAMVTDMVHLAMAVVMVMAEDSDMVGDMAMVKVMATVITEQLPITIISQNLITKMLTFKAMDTRQLITQRIL